jgi:glycosyltransferase involved in cell wall biosynthesis
MTKITWITSDCYFDVDLPVMKALSDDKQFEIEWHLIFTKNRISTFKPDEIEKEIGNEFVKFKYLFLNSRLRSVKTLFKFVRLMFKIRKSKSDIVYTDCDIEPYFSITTKLLLGSDNVICAIHDIEPHIGTDKIFYFFLDLQIKMFKNFHVFSNTQKDLLISKIDISKRNVFYAPMLLKNFGKSEIVPPRDIINFLFFGTIRKNKGLEYLIDAANRLAISHKGKFRLQIAGGCEEWSNFEKRILDYSVFDLAIEAVPNDNIPELFCKSHYLVLPYKDVTQSGPLMIAFNYGIPSIASNLPGFVENIRDNETGYLFESENTESLYTTMSSVILNHEANYHKLKQNLHTYVINNYSTEIIKSMYVDMFNKLNLK